MVILAPSSGEGPSILGKLKATFLFGVPNAGMETTQLRTMVKGEPTKDLIEDLSPRSRYLHQVDSLFSGLQATRKFRVLSFYETQTTKSVLQLPDGRWSRCGPEVVMVETHSATQKCSRDPEEVHSIDKDHSAMVKFGTGDLNYICVLDCIRGVLDQLSPLSGGSQRQATDRSFISEETDGQVMMERSKR